MNAAADTLHDGSGRPPRVLVACDFHAKYATNLARGLADAGARVMLLTRDHDLEFGGEVGQPDPGALRRYVTEVLGDRGIHVELPGRVSELRTLPELRSVRRAVRRFHPDVVHVQEGVWNDPRLLAAAGARPRAYAITVHDTSLHPGDKPDSRALSVGRRAVIGGAGLRFVHSAKLREELLRTGAGSAPVEVVPHGTDLPKSAPIPSEPQILLFGRLSHYKGTDVLLDALPAVWQALPAARLVIAGAGDVPAHPLLDDPRVDLRLGHVHEREVADTFTAARVVVLPYRQASQSGVGSRAKSHGRPLVVTTTGGLPDLVADGSGVAVAPEDPQALADAVVRVLADPGKAEEMGRQAALGAAESSWPAVGTRTLAAYARHLRFRSPDTRVESRVSEAGASR